MNQKNDDNRLFSNLIPEAQEVLAGNFRMLGEALISGVVNWGFEVIKHLAIFNGAGLAAAAALAQVAGGNVGAHAIALQAAHVFVVGLAIALVTMLVIYFTGIGYIRYFFDRTTQILLSQAPIDDIRPPVVFWVSVAVNWLLAGASAGTFFAGALKLMAIA